MPKSQPKSATIELKLAKPQELKAKLPKNWLNVDFLYAEPKLDGFRGIAICNGGKVDLYTSGGVKVVNGPKIVAGFETLHSPSYGNAVYDGEFFVKNWNDTGSIVKTLTPDHPKRKKLKFRVFDVLTMEEWNSRVGKRTMRQRRLALEKFKAYAKNFAKSIEVMQSDVLIAPNTLKEKMLLASMQNFHDRCVKGGHEGSVFKHPDEVYAFKKSNAWLKLKPYRESDVKVIGYKEGTGKHKGRLGAFLCKGKIDGKKVKFQVGGGLLDKERIEFWKRRKELKGIVIEVRHEGITVNNRVRFPRFRRERWDKKKP